MRIVEPGIEIMRTGLETEFIIPEQFIEKVGRTCYKSEDKITDDSAAKFVSNLIKRGHEAMIEHWSLIFTVNRLTYDRFIDYWNRLMHSTDYESGELLRPYLRFSDHMNLDSGMMRYVISGNMRAWRDYAKACVNANGSLPSYLWGMVRNYPLFFPEYQDYVPAAIVNDIMIPIAVSELSMAERRIHQDITLKLICDRGVTHEGVRHRVASFAQESTRYCNYSMNKFDTCISVVEPQFIKTAHESDRNDIIDIWERANVYAEKAYFDLLEAGCTPQEARCILPTDLKAELIVTMSLGNWDHFFELRDANTAHPDMHAIASMANHLFDEQVRKTDA